MSVLQLQRIDSNGTVRSLNDHFNLQLIPKQQVDQSVNNDLTGNTLASEPQRGYIQRIPSSNANGVNFFDEIFSLEQPGQEGVRETSRRLSISEYDVDNAGYYEYEYFGKKNDDMTRTSFNDNDEDVEMMSDEGLLPFEFDLGGVAVEAAQPQPVLNNFMAEQFTDPLVDGADEPQRKKVKDYFKLNIFGSGGSGAAEDKKKYFWSRKKKAELKNFEDEEVIVEETTPSVVINPSKLISNHEESVVRWQNSFDDGDDYLETEPLTQFTVFDPYVIEPGVEALAPPVVKRRSGSMPKPRGRKPSPIPDASKQFGCEYCDRRFKRQEHLKRHVRSLHMGEKPFNCTICGKKFSRSDNLNQHIKTHSHQ